MSYSAKPTEATIKRAIKAWQACGLSVGSVEIALDGTITIKPINPKDLQATNTNRPEKW